MAQRDYKNSAPRRGGSAKAGKKRGGLLITLLLVVFAGLLLAAVVLWFMWPRPQDFRKASPAPVLKTPPAAINTPATTEEKAAPQAPGTDAQNYTFYDILPGDKAPKPLPVKKDNEQWWLQVAALKSNEDADSLRARLALLNFSAVIEPTTKDDTTLYRVRVGPFPNQAAAESVQKKLAENKFEARPLKEAVVH